MKPKKHMRELSAKEIETLKTRAQMLREEINKELDEAHLCCPKNIYLWAKSYADLCDLIYNPLVRKSAMEEMIPEFCEKID